MLEIIQMWFSINSALIFEFKFSKDWIGFLTINSLLKELTDLEYTKNESDRLSELV